MFTIVLLTAMTAGENVAEFHPRGGGCGGGACYGGCYGYTYNTPYYGGCYGGAKHACGGGCYGGGWAKCHGGSCYGAAYGGCYGVGYTCSGGCWGASYSGYGPAPYSSGACGGCAGYTPGYACGGGGGCGGYTPGYACGGGCGGYLSAAYGVQQPVVGVAVGATPAEPRKLGLEEAPLGNRARVVFTLPEGAKLFVDGNLIEKAAEQKAFRTPELTPGTKYYYTAKVELTKDGQTMAGTKRIYVTAGQTVEEDLTAVDMKPDVLVSTR